MQYTLSPVVLIKQAGKACVRTIVSTIATSHFHKVVLVHQNTRFLCVCSKSHQRSFPVTPSVHVAGRVRKLGCYFTVAGEPRIFQVGPCAEPGEAKCACGRQTSAQPQCRVNKIGLGLGAWGLREENRSGCRGDAPFVCWVWLSHFSQPIVQPCENLHQQKPKVTHNNRKSWFWPGSGLKNARGATCTHQRHGCPEPPTRGATDVFVYGGL